jgi:hypothetical protein
VGVFLRAGLLCVWFGWFVFLITFRSVSIMPWILVENKIGGKQLPKWARSVALNTDGQIYIPAAMAGGENTILLCAIADNVEFIYEFEHIYLPLDYMRKQYPKTRETCDVIERRVGKVMAESKERA